MDLMINLRTFEISTLFTCEQTVEALFGVFFLAL